MVRRILTACSFLVVASVAARTLPAQAIAPMQDKEFLAGITPESWAHKAEGLEPCPTTTSAGQLAEQKWQVDSLAGTLSLPSDFHEAPVEGMVDGKRWIGGDSSTVEVHGTKALYRGGLGMGNMDIGRPLGMPTACALVLEGHPAPSHTLRVTRPIHGDTLYVDTPSIVVRYAVGLQFVVLTHSPARQAMLLTALKSLKVSPVTPH
jgi:hypothetical protein